MAQHDSVLILQIDRWSLRTAPLQGKKKRGCNHFHETLGCCSFSVSHELCGVENSELWPTNRCFRLSPVPFSFKNKKPQCPFSNFIVIPVAVEQNGVVDRLLNASIHLMYRHSVCYLCGNSDNRYSSSGRGRRKMVSLEKESWLCKDKVREPLL